MKITKRIDNEKQLIEIKVSGNVSENGSRNIIQSAIVEAYGSDYREMVLDLQEVNFDPSTALFRLHCLLQVFKSVILQKELRVAILFKTGDDTQWMYLNKAEEFEGITLRYFTDRKAALLGARLFAIPSRIPPALDAGVCCKEAALN